MKPMRATPRLLAYLRSRRRPAAPPPPRTPLPDNPYHRCFTADRTFEELVRTARTREEAPGTPPQNTP